jgi:glutathionylspermidine synthase
LDTLLQAGRGGAILELAEIGWDPVQRIFIDDLNCPIQEIFKLYPWEWLMREEFGPHLLESETQFVEPMYKAAFSSKGMLPLLWEYFPGHPNLLESYRSSGKLSSYARKPILSREGQNVALIRDGRTIAAVEGDYGAEGWIDQALCTLPSFGDAHAVIGSWVIGGAPAGIGIRESSGLITTDQSQFVPHFFE